MNRDVTTLKKVVRNASQGRFAGGGAASFNPRPAGGGRLNAPPSGFSRIAKKRRRAAPPGFHPPYPPSFPQLL